MDFGDILKLFSAILVPIIILASKQSKKAKQDYDNKYRRTSVNTKRALGQSQTTSPREYMPYWKEGENIQEIKPQPNNNKGYTIPEVSLESHDYNEEDYIKQRTSLESSEYTVKDSKERYQKTTSFKKGEIMDVIRDSEIGSEELNLKFDRSQLVQGIVMSEILSKPKSLRR